MYASRTLLRTACRGINLRGPAVVRNYAATAARLDGKWDEKKWSEQFLGESMSESTGVIGICRFIRAFHLVNFSEELAIEVALAERYVAASLPSFCGSFTRSSCHFFLRGFVCGARLDL